MHKPEFLSYDSNKQPSDSPLSIQIASKHSHLQYPTKEPSEVGRSSDVAKIKRTLDVLCQMCMLCWLKGIVGSRGDHLLTQCPDGPLGDPIEYWRSGLTFEVGTCFGCRCPQHVHEDCAKYVCKHLTMFCSSVLQGKRVSADSIHSMTVILNHAPIMTH
jgi:hypothetical protein